MATHQSKSAAADIGNIEHQSQRNAVYIIKIPRLWVMISSAQMQAVWLITVSGNTSIVCVTKYIYSTTPLKYSLEALYITWV